MEDKIGETTHEFWKNEKIWGNSILFFFLGTSN